MFDDPSSGSKATTYFASLDISSWKVMNSLFSSEATPRHCPPSSRAAINRLFANTSSFLTSSPCTLTVPTLPRISTSPALLTSLLTTFAASPKSLRSLDKSPLAYGNSDCFLIMNSSRVSTPIITLYITKILAFRKIKAQGCSIVRLIIQCFRAV